MRDGFEPRDMIEGRVVRHMKLMHAQCTTIAKLKTAGMLSRCSHAWPDRCLRTVRAHARHA